MTPSSRRICPLAPYVSNLIFWIVCYLYPGWPRGAASYKVRSQPVGTGLREQQEGWARLSRARSREGFAET